MVYMLVCGDALRMRYLKNKTVRAEISQGKVCMRNGLNVTPLFRTDGVLCNGSQLVAWQKVLFCVAKDGKTHCERLPNGLQNVPDGWRKMAFCRMNAAKRRSV